MESKEKVQMNLSTKQKQSYRCRKQTNGYQGVRGVGGINWKILKKYKYKTTIYEIHTTICKIENQ